MALSVVVSLGLGGFYDAPRPHGNSGPKDAGHQLPNNVYIQLVRLLSLSPTPAVHFQRIFRLSQVAPIRANEDQ